MSDLSESFAAGTLYELLAAHARRDANAAAILAPGRDPLGFGGLLEQIEDVRTTLNGWGLGRGDRIALLIGRGPEAAAALLAITCSAVCVPLNAAGTMAELEQGLTQTKAKALLVPASAAAGVDDLCRRLGIILLECSVADSATAGRFNLRGGRAAATSQCGPAAAADLILIMGTSGTSARSKIVPISSGNVVARTDKSRRLFGLTPADRCLNLMPLCYNHGLHTGLMAPLCAGGSVICPPVFDVETFLSCVRDFDATWYTASFTYHQTILDWLEQRPHALDGHRLRFIRAASGPLSPRVCLDLERIVGVPVVEAYGTTETGTVASNPPAGLRKISTVGISPDRDVAIMDADGQLVSSDVTGEVVVHGATVFMGYENDPAANERAFHKGWYRTGDCGFMDAEGYLKLLGRLDEVINRGGEKISPREIDEALLEHDAVVHAVCFSVPHPTLHHEVAAAVVLRSGADVTEDDLRKFLALRLTSFKIPRRIIFAGELPKGPTGKFARSRLAEHFGLTGGKSTGAIAEAHTTIQRILLTFWREVLGRDDIGVDDDFFLLGGDSMTALDLLLRIEKGLQYRLPLTVLAEAPTVRTLEGRLERSTLGAIGNTIRVNGEGARHPLFAICGRFGHALRLLPVLRALGPDQPGFALQPPDMDWTSVGCVTLSHMAAHYIGQVKAVQPRGPYRLLGTSFGGLVAFEMALQLQAAGEAVEFLGLVDANPPTCLIEGVVDVSHSTDDPPVARPKNWIEDINNSVAEAHLHARSLYVLDAGSRANRFRGELTYFYCTGNPIVANDRRRLWQRFADRLKLLPLSGVHGTYNLDPQFTDLTALLRGCLSGATAPASDPVSIFDRTYRIDSRDTHQIVSSTGEVFRIGQDVVLGHVDALHADPKRYRIVGWAVDPCKQNQPQTIAVFVNDKFLGYGACGVLRTDVAEQLASSSARYAGFNFSFEREAAGGKTDLPRLFALSSGGRAVELRSAEPRG